MGTENRSALCVAAAMACVLFLAAPLAVHAQTPATSGASFTIAGVSDASQISGTFPDSATAVSHNLFMVVPDMDDDDSDDPSPEKDAETGKTLSVSDKICVRAASRRISQAAMFHSNLFAPFKSRPPP